MNWHKLLFAGYATICMEFESNKYYFRIKKINDAYELYEVVANNISDYASNKEVFQCLFSFSGLPRFISKKTLSRQCRVFGLAIRCILRNKDGFLTRLGVKINHAGYCAKCNRLLKTPEAIKYGIGNECFKDMNINPKEKIVYVGLTSDQDDQSSSSGSNKKRRGAKRSVKDNDRQNSQSRKRKDFEID